MNKLQAKVEEVLSSLVPIVLFVGLIILVLVPVDTKIALRFLIGAFLLFLGLSIFLWGVDQSMQPIGSHMAKQVATSKTIFGATAFAFVLGFLITVAEPDLLILGEQVESASGGSLGARFMVAVVSAGVGVMISIGSLRLLLGKKFHVMMALLYGLIAILGIFVTEEFLAIAFDSSGATTGALTTPFILALSLGLSMIKGGRSSEADSFGMVGVMSAGPIVAVLLLSLLSGQRHIQGEAAAFQVSSGILSPILEALPATLLESLVSLGPITVLFFVSNALIYRVSGKELFGIVRGLIYTLLGLTLFLVGANQGFMDMGRLLGMGLAENYAYLLLPLGFLLGYIVVSAEPAVHVLGKQVEEVTAGNIPARVLSLTLSIGVGLAVSLSMLRIMVPEVKLWYFLLPGFALAILLSFYVEDIFVGIAYDSGGVASGPMAATFVLAFAQGVADMWPSANVLRDGFGIIAMIAMTPVLSVMILGAIAKMKQKRSAMLPEDAQIGKDTEVRYVQKSLDVISDMVVVTVNRGMGDQIVEKAREEGAIGATILHGRDARSSAWSRYSLQFEPEKEMVLLIVPAKLGQDLVERFTEESIVPLNIFTLPLSRVSGLTQVEEKRLDEHDTDSTQRG